MQLPDELRGRALSRRDILAYAGFVGAGAFLSRPARTWAASQRGAELIQKAAAVRAAGSDLGAVEHIIFLMMENRSYDHYFGAYPKGRGFDDHPKHSLGVFAQDFPTSVGASLVPKNTLVPFHLDSVQGFECTDDLTHEWGPMHECWNNGKMDSWVKVHTSPQWEGPHGAMTMGYYQRADLPFYYALADNFTLLDGYHASILGPTHPNRLMANSGTIDPEGKMGGPITETNSNPDTQWNCTWTTMQEVLEDAGVSWKVYSPSNLGTTGKYASLSQYDTWNPALYDPTNPEVMLVSDHVLPYFSAFRNPLSPLYAKAFNQTFPNDFVADIGKGALPSVSWMIPPLGFDDHPSAAPDNGMWFLSLVLDALVENPEVWSKTALFLMYDENDGWFDHVPPPTPPAGTPGESLTAPIPSQESDDGDTLGITGPLGLGVRVPALMISPFSRGGEVVSETFDHTSQLKLVSERFGVEVPNVSAWRRSVVGDLTSTMFHHPVDATMPSLPATAVQAAKDECADEDTEGGGAAPSVTTIQRMPNQQGGSTPASYYFTTPAKKKPAKKRPAKKKHHEAEKHHTKKHEKAHEHDEREITEDHRTQLMPAGPSGHSTAKSRPNRLTKTPA